MYQPKRPGPVTACAVLFFVFGGLGLVGSVCSLGVFGFFASFLSSPPPPAPGQPNFVELWKLFDQRAPSFKYYIFISLGIGLVLCLIEVIAGVGLMKMRYWGRRLGLFYGFATIVLALGAAWYSFTILNPAMKAWQQDMQKWMQAETQKAAKAAGGGPPPPAPPPPAFASNPLVDAMGSVMGTAINLIYPIVVLILLLLPSTGKAFAIANGDAPPEPAEREDDFDRRRDDFEDPRDRPAERPPPEPSDDYRFRARDE
jgi:hypothetical protein